MEGSQTPREANVSERSQGEWPNAAQVSSEMRTKRAHWVCVTDGGCCLAESRLDQGTGMKSGVNGRCRKGDREILSNPFEEARL